MREELLDMLNSSYGHYDNELNGEFAKFYFITDPLNSTAVQPNYWGDLGTPDIHHYNSEVFVVMKHPGERTDWDTVELQAGSHSVFWTADTLLDSADLVWIPDVSGLGSTKKKAKKEAAKKTWKQKIKGWYKLAKNAAKDVYTDIAKNKAKKTKKKLKAYGKKKIEEKAKEKSITSAAAFVLDNYFLQGYVHGKTTRDTQGIFIIDAVSPTITGHDTIIEVEALEPGGVSSGKHLNNLRNLLNVNDNCDPDPDMRSLTARFWPLSLQENGDSIPSDIEWTASDKGAASATGGVNSTSVTQQVRVVDTKPPILVAPPPVIMEIEASETMNVSLGMPEVFDVADLRPTISNDGPATFGQGVHYVNWTATDFSGNVSEATDDSVQIVNLKEPGTNNLPSANSIVGSDAIDAISYEPVKITVTGQDPDQDPLWFSIDQEPEDGFFVAPLYPYFIDDYRMTARYSAQIAAAEGEEFAWELAQNTGAMKDYMSELCADGTKPEDLPIDFVNGIEYIGVDDDGYTYIYDRFYNVCGQGSTIAPKTDTRISVWDRDGEFVGQKEWIGSDGGGNLHSVKFNFNRGTVISVQSQSTTTGSGVLKISNIQVENQDAPIADSHTYNLLNEINAVYVGENEEKRVPKFRNGGAAAFDNTNNILYIIGQKNYANKGLVALQPAPCNNSGKDGPEDCLELIDVLVHSNTIIDSTQSGPFPGIGADAMKLSTMNDIALDSTGAVHVISQNRIYKFGPATTAADGSITVGEFVGWMGACDSGENCDYINQRSIGYSCTDETCFNDSVNYGSRPGQFDNPTALAFDPNDVLYVADTDNARVQRFSNEGFFAGEAVSTGDGDGFVLGDFGNPKNIVVNQGSFYVLDTQADIVHVFDASVIHGIDETSAWVEYQSENNFVGTDSFTFVSSDGFRNSDGETLTSDPATVEVNVTRNFRPPLATAGLVISTTEDTPVPMTLEGYDIDGDLDTLTFDVVGEPGDGTLTGSGANRIYTPRADFNGEDSILFTVSDGRFTSQPEEFLIGISPINDKPVLDIDTTPRQVGLGFPFSLQATALDPEISDDLTIVIDWGDGVVEVEGTALDDGTLTGPVINPSGTITRTILAYHNYETTGDFTLTLTVSDPSGAFETVAIPVTVEVMADLALQRRGNSSASPTRSSVSYELVAVNLPPNESSSSNPTSNGVIVRETLGEGMSYVIAGSSAGDCTAVGRNLTCTLGDLAPNEMASIQIVASVDPALPIGTEISTEATVEATTPDPIPENSVNQGLITLLTPADFLVDSPLDENDANPGDGICATSAENGGLCTLRAAIEEANAFGGRQTIALPRGEYMLNFDAQTLVRQYLGIEPRRQVLKALDSAASGDLDITEDLLIIGLGADATELDANAEDRLFEISNGAVVEIRDIALTGGKVTSSYGGGIYNVDGQVTLSRVLIHGNYSNGGGGGIANRGGSMLVVNSSIVGNDADGGSGGAILNSDAELVLQNVTVSGNMAGNGAGLQTVGGTATLQNVTVVNNIASGAGGAFNNTSPSDLMVTNSLIVGNEANFGPVCGYVMSSGGYNVFDNLSDCTVTGETVSNIIDDDFFLYSLEQNVSQTHSHTPDISSSAIDNGRCDFPADQRGVARPQGNGCDIGAVEFEPSDEIEPPPPPTPDLTRVFLPIIVR